MRWYLTREVVGEPEIDVRDDDGDLTLGYSIMRELARSDATLVEIAAEQDGRRPRGLTWTAVATPVAYRAVMITGEARDGRLPLLRAGCRFPWSPS
jgi:hypothetical protein